MTAPDRSLRDPAFDRAFVAVSYFVGRRGPDLLAPLADPSPQAKELVRALGAPEQAVRAAVLGRELERVARQLEQWRLR